jgi:hypothetical protein
MAKIDGTIVVGVPAHLIGGVPDYSS